MARLTLPARLRGRTPLTVTVAAGTVVAGLLATLAFVAPGYPTQEVEIDDSSVWVTNAATQMVGLANTELTKLSTATSSKSGTLDVIQAPGRMLVHDPASNTVELFDPAEVVTAGTVPLPQGTPRLAAGGTQLLIYQPDSGDVWAQRYSDLAAFDKDSAPAFGIGVDAVLAADADDRYVGYSAKSGQLVTGSLVADGKPEHAEIAFQNPGAEPQATLVGGTPVVYDPQAGQVWIDGTLVSVADAVTSPETAVLMAPSVTGDDVLIAFDGGLVAVSLRGGDVTPRTGGSGPAAGSGAAATPLRAGTCDYAVWGDGTAYRDCGDPQTFSLDGATGSRPALRVNGRTVVATEPDTGLTWAIQHEGELIDNWGDFVDDSEVLQEQQDVKDSPPEPDPTPQAPIAVDDELGVRAGRANRLPVLVNDSDPNGDPIVITDFQQIDPSWGRLDLIREGQELQVTTTAEASGTVTFEYTITDGHGLQDTATVTLTVYPPEVNNPPVQVRPTRTSVASGYGAQISVLDDWIDPEADPLYLKEATAPEGDTVTFTPDGMVEFTDGGGPGTLKSVALVVSDGAADGSGDGHGTLDVTVGAVGTVPIIAENFAVRAVVGQELTVEPLTEVRGGTGPITLNAARGADDDTSLGIESDFTAGTFTIRPTQAGTHWVDYSVTDSTLASEAKARIRVEVVAPPDEQPAPVTVPTTAFLTLDSTQLVDVLATDYDPAGGVLSIVDVDGVDPASGIVVEVVEHRILRVTLRRPLEAGPVTLAYTVTNGHLPATGTLTLVEVPEPAKYQPPVAVDDSVTVRVGSVVDIPVLDNDRQPNGKPLMLDPELVAPLGEGEGTLVASGNILRYLAPDAPGEYSATYRVSSTDGQWATAKVSITVKDVDLANNRAPQPRTITTRVGAGQQVTIPVPLGSIDPDGDLVTLVGQGSAPQYGAVVDVGTSSIVYAASQYSGSGTDTFTYTVVDALGATAEGTIRVGIVPDSSDVAPPVAMDDAVKARPGTQLSINVVANDSDPAQGTLRISGVEPVDPSLRPTYTDTSIRVTAPSTPGPYGIFYTVANEAGLTSTATLFLQVDPDAPLIAPEAHDVVLTLEEINGRPTVDADVLSAVTFAEGSADDLLVQVPGDVSGARVTASRAVTVEVRPTSRIIPFTVSRADDPTVSSTAFLWIPGTDDARPELRADAPALTVVSGKPLRIPLGDHVIAAGNKKVVVDDFATISATHDDGSQLWIDNSTLTFTSDADYWGPASITVTVNDGRNRATVNLPITVTPAKDQPAALRSASIPLEAGAETTIDLAGLTDYPGDQSALVYAVDDGDKGVVSASVSGGKLTIRAVDGVAVGSQATLAVSVRDAVQAGRSGTITVTIAQSTRPTVVAVPDELTIRRGGSQSVDVLANDSATNPFPGKPLRVVSVGGTPPAGVKVTTSADKRTVSVSVAKDAATGSVTLPYQVADATNDPARYVTGTLTVRVQDVPDAPSGPPRVTSTNPENASVVLAIPHAFPNFSDITEYVVTTADGATAARCTNPDACTVTGLTYGQAYQFAAYAVNGVGQGAASPLGATTVVDLTPNAPTAVTLVPTADDPEGHSMRVTWSNSGQVTKGSAIAGFDIALSGPGVDLHTTAEPGATSAVLIDGGIAATNSYQVSVVARNKTHGGPAGTASAVAIGPPSIGSALATPTPDGGMNVIIADGNAAGGSGPAYQVVPAPGPTTCDPGTITPNTTDGVYPDTYVPGRQYTILVSNGLFCRVFTSSAAPEPPTVTGGSLGLGAAPELAISVTDLTASDAIDHYEYRLVIAGAAPIDWTPDGNVLRDQRTFGRATAVSVRACFGTVAATCGPPRELGTVTPYHAAPTNLHCYADGTPPTADQPSPANNGPALTIQIRYSEVDPGTNLRTNLTTWQPLGGTVPTSPAGHRLDAEWRTLAGSTALYVTPPAECP